MLFILHILDLREPKELGELGGLCCCEQEGHLEHDLSGYLSLEYLLNRSSLPFFAWIQHFISPWTKMTLCDWLNNVM